MPICLMSGVASMNVAETAANMGLQVHNTQVRSADEFDTALQTLNQANVGAFVAINSPLTFNRRAELAAAALKYRLASISSAKDIAEEGALLSYASDLEYLTSHAADYVDKILRGAKPTDLPVEQVSKYLLVINLKTAKALGLAIPPALLARADEVIE
jgi:putative tryptophan/tyrosine transport system substrate-binding protein